MRAPQRTLVRGSGSAAHIYWNGTALVDLRGNAYTMAGTVPQVAAVPPLPAGGGSYSAVNYYQTPANVDVFDQAGDFAAYAVFRLPATGLINAIVAARNAGATTGWMAFLTATGTGQLTTYPTTAAAAATVNVASTTELNVLCWGRAGTTVGVKLNLGDYVTAGPATIATTTDTPTRIGLGVTGTLPFTGVLFEVGLAQVPVSDAWCSAVAQSVKAKLGTTW